MQGRQLGGLTLARAVEMVMPFDRKAFFPETAPAEWAPYESWLKPAAMDPATGALLFTIQSYVVRTSHHTILIDSCVGNHKERANRPLWHRKTDDTYLRALASLGLAPEDIDYVVCTHLHSDHVGWNTRLEDGRWVPTFPKARYVFSEEGARGLGAGPPEVYAPPARGQRAAGDRGGQGRAGRPTTSPSTTRSGSSPAPATRRTMSRSASHRRGRTR